MTDIAGGFGLAQLKKLDKMNDIRRKNATWLENKIKSSFEGIFEFQGGDKGFFILIILFLFSLQKKQLLADENSVNFWRKIK